MKKIFLFVCAAALMAVACNKSESISAPEVPVAGEITMKAITNAATKAGELDGTILNKDYGIYAAATQKNASGLIENASFFSGGEQLFATADDPATASSQWKASPAQYWPLGGARLDFLAYAQLKTPHDAANSAGKWVHTWDNASTDIASKLSFYDVDTYANQEDILYAASNGMNRDVNSPASDSKTVPMTFNHAQALLIFNVKINSEGSNKIAINEISFVNPARVDQLRVKATADVAYAAQKAAAYADIDADGDITDKAAAKAAWDTANPAPVLADLTDAQVTLKTIGDFSVDNSRNVLQAAWTFDGTATSADNYRMPTPAHRTWELAKAAAYAAIDADEGITDKANAKAAWDTANPEPEADAKSPANKVGTSLVQYDNVFATSSDYAQLGETLLIPEQEKVNFTIKYTVGNNVMYYTFNDLRGVWKMGHKYYYNLDLTVNEIVITETVVDFQSEQAAEDLGL